MKIGLISAGAIAEFLLTEINQLADAHQHTTHLSSGAIVGDSGVASFVVKNNPLPLNPYTSYLATISILGTLERLNHRIKIKA